jgi:glycosyltransferase involved in cell wall biosynthesis
MLPKKYPDWRLRFVGGDMGLDKNKVFKKYLIDEASRLGIHNQVEWLDFSSNLDKHFLECSFVLVFSESESFSMICLEAMNAARAVIATRCGGPEEIIDHEKNGILVGVGNHREMASSIERLINDRDLVCRWGEEAKKSVFKKFSFPNTVYKLIPVIENALARNHSRPQ